jgi:hypothetical protein
MQLDRSISGKIGQSGKQRKSDWPVLHQTVDLKTARLNGTPQCVSLATCKTTRWTVDACLPRRVHCEHPLVQIRPPQPRKSFVSSLSVNPATIRIDKKIKTRTRGPSRSPATVRALLRLRNEVDFQAGVSIPLAPIMACLIPAAFHDLGRAGLPQAHGTRMRKGHGALSFQTKTSARSTSTAHLTDAS